MGLYDRIVITGGGGMLAGALRRLLGQRGLPAPHVCDRPACDVADADAVRDLFARLRPTLLLNCAAYTKVDLAEQEEERANAVNGAGPANLAAACRELGTKLVHYSTDYVFDGTLRRPLRPGDPVGPQCAYGRSKLLGEQAVQQIDDLDFLILRTAWLYGTGGPNFVQTMVKAAQVGKPLNVINDQVGSPTYTIDLAEATLGLLDRGAAGIWHVSNAGQTTWFDFAKAIFEEWDLSPALRPTTSAEWKATRPDSAVRPAYSVFDVSPVEKLLGRSMRDWRDALKAFKVELDAASDR